MLSLISFLILLSIGIMIIATTNIPVEAECLSRGGVIVSSSSKYKPSWQGSDSNIFACFI